MRSTSAGESIVIRSRPAKSRQISAYPNGRLEW
jgi:hypothetical protein